MWYSSPKINSLSLIFFSLFPAILFSQDYKVLMEDMSVNFYTVCEAAEGYFETIEKEKKGSGYKPYLRWKHANEYKYYPSGIRNNVNPYQAVNAYNEFKSNNVGISYSSGWHELGPFIIDSISSNYGAGLGRVEDFYVDPIDSNKIYLGSRSGGFWKTTNGGITWQGSLTDTLVAGGVNAIAVSPTNADSILINTQNSNNSYTHGLYRSVDGGNSWSLSNFNPTNLGLGGLGSNFKIWKIAYHPLVPNVIVIGTNQGVYISNNNLQTWSVLINTGDIRDIEFHPTDSNIIYVYNSGNATGVRNHIYRSTNMGLSFTQSSLIAGNNNARGAMSVSAVCDSCLYFASTNGVWKSKDNGVNFSFIINPSSGCADFAVSDVDTSNLLYGGVDVFSSTNSGDTFNQVTWWSLGGAIHGGGSLQSNFSSTDKYVHADTRRLKCINGVFYDATDGFLCKSTDNGISWQILSQGTAIRENYKFGASQSNHYRSISGSQDNGLSIKHQNNWIEFFGADGMEGIIHPLNDDWMIGSFQNGGRRRTDDGGSSIDIATPPNSNIGYWEAPLNYDPNNQMRIYDFRDSVYVSEDFGSNWVTQGKASSFSGTIKEAAIAENNSNIIVVSSNRFIDKSINGGASFVSIKNNLPNSAIHDIAFDPNNDDIIIVVYASWQNDNSKVYITYNGGSTWSNITYNLGNMPIHTVVIDHTDSSNIYIGAEIGVYTKTLNANSWSLYNPNLPNTTIGELEIVKGSNTLKAATWGRGLWEYSLIGRNNFPSILITKITDQPTANLPLANIDQSVTSIISYDNNLSSVFVKWSVNTPSFGNTIPMTNTADSTWVSQTALPNYPIGTKMYFKVFAVGNNNDTSETYKFMYTVKPFEYCNGSGQSNGLLFTNNVTINNINNTSGNDGYTYYKDSIVYLFRDSTYAISLNANNNWANNKCNAWIDYNYNAVFDTTESLALSPFSGTLSQSNFTVPSTANINDTLRLRTRLAYWGQVAEPCGTTLGEVEDYPVIVIGVPTFDFSVSDSSLCQGDLLYVNYNMDVADSVQWNFSDGVISIISKNFNDSIVLSSTGNYDLKLTAFQQGFPFEFELMNFLTVNKTDSLTLQTITCNQNQVDTTVLALTNVFGCDSVITTIALLNPLNPTVTDSFNILTAQPSGLAYNWLDCDNNYSLLQGETNQVFVATKNGNYAVQISDSLCIDTSSCVEVKGISVFENNFDSKILLYPNPTSGKVSIDFGKTYPSVYISVRNIIGQGILTKSFNNTDKANFEIQNAVGFYIIEIRTKDKSAVFKVLKE